MKARARVSAALSRYGVLLLLVSVASVQQILVWKAQISPWKGAGFGMFATVDDPGLRLLRASVVGEDVEVQLNLGPFFSTPSRIDRHLQRARYVPTESSLVQAAQVLRGRGWVAEADDGVVRLRPAARGEPATALSEFGARLRVEVFARTVGRDPISVRLERLRVLEVDLER